MKPSIPPPAGEAERFRAVWERVCLGGCGGYLVPGPAAAPAPAVPGLEEFLREAVDQSLARARCCGGAAALAPLAQAYRREARVLAAVLFLRTGVRYLPAACRPAPRWGSLAERCRDLYRRERRAERRLRRASGAVEDEALAALLARLAEDSARRQETLAQLTAGAL